MKRIAPLVKVVLFLTVIAAVALTTTAYADRLAAGGGCPRDIECPDVWIPVICDDGQIYSNSCYAYRACATGCVPLGIPPVE